MLDAALNHVTLLAEPRRCQSDRSASEYRHRGHLLACKQRSSQLRRTPGQRNPCSSVTIVVDDKFFSELLRLNHKSGWAEGAETDDGTDFAVRRDQHWSKITAISRKRIQSARPTSITAGNDGPCCCHRSRVQELSAIHDILRKKTGRRWSCEELYSRYC